MKIAVLVSGGVDSSVALKLLQEQGHEITAFYLKIWLEDELSYLGSCPWAEDLAYVTQVCDQLKVPLQVVSLQKEYWDNVVAYTIKEIKDGRTPNPDIFCNKTIKFGLFFDYLKKENLFFDKVASGHYAQIKEEKGIYHLLTSPDEIKDQTYFLSYLNQEQLSNILFPIGHLKKEHVRALAEQFNLPNKKRKDSQGICFLGKLKFSEFIHHYLGVQEGDLVEFETNNVIGKHKGYWYYTIGQRQGLGLAGGPWFVVAKDIAHNRVLISKNYYSQDKQRKSCEVEQCNWIFGKPQTENLTVKLRHGFKKNRCSIKFLADNRLSVTLEDNDQGIAQGQFAVFYDGTLCIGSGIISA